LPYITTLISFHKGAPEPPQEPLNPSHFSNKHLLKVIQRYHTDRNSSFGEEWLVLSEEVRQFSTALQVVYNVVVDGLFFQISKELTARYNVMKGAN
jgi:hypothetical protein